MGISASGKRVAPSEEESAWWTLQLAAGRTDNEIAVLCGIKKETAKSRTKALIRSSGAKNRHHFVALMVGTGLVDFTSWQASFPSRKKDEPFYEKEIVILELVAAGHRDSEIAKKLACSHRTLELIRHKLAQTRGVTNRVGCLVADYLFACQGK